MVLEGWEIFETGWNLVFHRHSKKREGYAIRLVVLCHCIKTPNETRIISYRIAKFDGMLKLLTFKIQLCLTKIASLGTQYSALFPSS